MKIVVHDPETEWVEYSIPRSGAKDVIGAAESNGSTGDV